MDNRFCARDDKPVREIRSGDSDSTKLFGRTTEEIAGKYYHVGGRGPCGKQFLEEHETYTENDHVPD